MSPFKSKAQRNKFHALKAQGKMSQETIDKWESETSGPLPERKTFKKMESIAVVKPIQGIKKVKVLRAIKTPRYK